MNGYLTKPFKAHDLFTAVEEWATPTPPSARPAPVDLEAFRSTMREADAEDGVDAIVATFVTALPAHLEMLVAAARAKNAGGVQRAAHAFKSAAAAIGAAGLATLLADVEKAARDGDVDPAGHALKRVRQEADAVLDHLRAAGAP
jgi:HPt (histidine-containing phosphotransfer) domain-containing protein